MSALADERLTAAEWSEILRDPMLDRRYLRTAFGPTIAEFLSYMENERGDRPATLDSYERDLARLAVMFPHKGPGDFVKDDIRQARDSYPAGSRKRALAAWKSCFGWLYMEERIGADPAALIPYPRPGAKQVYKVFTATEQKQLVTAGPDTQYGRAIEVSHRASILLILDAGLRAAEFRALRLGNVDFINCWIVVEHGKGDKARVVPFDPDDRLAKALKFFASTPVPRVLDDEGELVGEVLPDEDAHFLYPVGVNATGLTWTKPWKELTYSPFRYWWVAVCKRARVRYRKPHMGRHTLITEIIRESGAERAQKIAGHESIRTTVDTYGWLDVEDARDAVSTRRKRRAS